MKLRNVIKFVILSTVLSDTCLFAARTCHISVGFCDYQTSLLESYVHHPYNGVLYFDIDCGDYSLDEWHQHAYYKCFVKPVDEKGEEVDWMDFSKRFPSASERKGAKSVPGDEVPWGEEKYYKVYRASAINDGWVGASFGIDNDADGFSFRCGRFFIRLDKEGVLYLSGGEKGDSLLLNWRKQSKCERLPNIPVVFDNRKALEREYNKKLFEDVKKGDADETIFRCRNKKIFEGSTLIIENFPTAFTNEGSIGFDSIILRNITVKNKGWISVRNLILDNKSVLENEGEIRWSDFFDSYRESKVVGKGPVVRGKSTDLSYKIEPIVDEELGDGFGYWLRWDNLQDWEEIKFPRFTRGVTLYLRGQCNSNRRPSCMDFVKETERQKIAEAQKKQDKEFVKETEKQKIEEAQKKQDKENGGYRISSYEHWNPKREQVYNPMKEQVYVGLFDYRRRLCPVRFNSGEANLYVIFDCDWDAGLNETMSISFKEGSFNANDSKDNSSLEVSGKQDKKDSKEKSSPEQCKETIKGDPKGNSSLEVSGKQDKKDSKEKSSPKVSGKQDKKDSEEKSSPKVSGKQDKKDSKEKSSPEQCKETIKGKTEGKKEQGKKTIKENSSPKVSDNQDKKESEGFGKQGEEKIKGNANDQEQGKKKRRKHKKK